MKQILLLLVSATTALTSIAQNNDPARDNKGIALIGHLQNEMDKKPIGGATVSLLNAKDSSLVAFTRTDSLGNFKFTNLEAGKYRLSASQLYFHPQWKDVVLRAGNGLIELAAIGMKDKSLLETVTLKAQRPPVEVNGDTIEFNTESFRTKPNAMVEDMLKKMPGIEVDKDGAVRVNGKKINRVLVNGKDFFNGDPTMATRNLAADAVDKVQVFDKQSDQAAFTGFDDGNAEKTINLKLKKDKKNAAFGKVTAAAGTHERYDGQFNVNKFKDEQQLSVIGMANNTNRQGFAIMDMLNFTGQARKMMGGGGGMIISTGNPEDFGLPVSGINNNRGINTTIAGGINYSDNWDKRTDVNASYFYNQLMPRNTSSINRRNILPGNNFTWLQNSNSSSNTRSNRFNLSADHKIDSFNSIKLTAVMGYQQGNAASESDYQSFIPGGKILNNGITATSNNTEGYNASTNVLFRHKFKKRGRTFSVNAAMQYNDSRLNGTLNSISNFLTNDVITARDTINQLNKINGLTQSYGANISYTEPLSKRALLELKAFYNNSSGDLDRSTFDYNTISGKHDHPNSQLSNAFESQYHYMGGGASIRAIQKKYGYTLGANLQYAELSGQQKNGMQLSKQYFTNLLPVASFNYSFSKMKTLRVDYNSSTTQPNASQLQPVKDLSDPQNIKEGNPFLGQSYNHNLNLQFMNANPAKQNSMFAFINYYATQHAIVNSDVIDAGGTRTTKPVNAEGVYFISGNLDKNFRVKKLNTRFGVGGNIAYNRSVNFINQQKNKTGNLSFAPRVSVSYIYKEILDISFYSRVSYNRARYSLQSSLNNNFWRQTYELETTVRLPAGFTVNSEFTYSVYSGRANGYNQQVKLWNAAIAKQVLKSKKGEIKISGYDLLKQNVGVDRNTNSNYIEDIQYQALQRYFTLGFTYSLQKAVSGGPKAVIRTF